MLIPKPCVKRSFCIQTLFLATAVLLLSGCATVTQRKFDTTVIPDRKTREVMERKGNIVQLSGDAEDSKPVLVLLHGATADPSEMLEIAREWKEDYDVFLYS